MKKIQPASIMGSLRFWFEVICHFSGINEHFKYDINKKRRLKIHDKYIEILSERKKYPEHEICEKLMLTPTEYYFGTTGWKSKLGIESIKPINDWCLGNKLNLPFGIKYCDQSEQWNDLKKYDQKCNERDCHCWFFPGSYFWGKFAIDFTTESEKITKNILFPLLNFIQEYGFLGGKNNIGFGRVKVLEKDVTSNPITVCGIPIDKHKYLCEKEFEYDELKLFKDILSNVKKSDDFLQISKTIQIITVTNDQVNKNEWIGNLYLELIKNLLLKKMNLRRKINDDKLRHKIFGSTQEKDAEAAKIIPLIRKNDEGQLEGNLISFAGILSLEDGDKHE
jgi:CRISPR-associated protein Cmr1